MAKKIKVNPKGAGSEASPVFDVSKPGSTAASPNSRPLVIKHGPMLKQDPMVKDEDISVTAPRLKIVPVDDSTKESKEKVAEDDSSVDTLTEKSEINKDNKEESAVDIIEDDSNQKSENNEASAKVELKESNAVDVLADAAEKNSKKNVKEDEEQIKKIEQLVESKQYYLPIVEGGKKASMERFLSWLILILLVLSVVAYLAADAGYLDIGIDLPYDFIKN